jgi:hypothetical protein
MDIVALEKPINSLLFKQYFSKSIQSGYEMGILYAFDCGDAGLVSTAGNCHAGLGNLAYWVPGKKTRFYSQLRCGSDLDRGKADKFWDALFDPIKSPWRALILDFTYHYSKDGSKRIAFSIKVDDDTPTQLLANLAILSRLPSEHEFSLNLFDRLVDKDVDPTLALIFSCLGCLYKSHEESVTLLRHTPGHYGLPVDAFSLKNLLSANPMLDESLILGRNSTYLPCNNIWKGTDKAERLLIKPAVVEVKKVRVFEKLFEHHQNFYAKRKVTIVSLSSVIDSLKRIKV